MQPLISAGELAGILNKEDLVIADTSNGPHAKASYDTAHLHGALYVDLNTQLADIKDNAANGGRHPLPSPEQFAQTLTSLGISNSSHVVIYDDKNGSNAAARMWWMMKAIGHEKVQVLDGGFQAAQKEGLPVDNGPVSPKTTTPYKANGWQLPQVNIEEVEKRAAGKNFVVIDVRDAYRYNGESEPIDLVAGHIPGAVNVPFSGNLEDNGLFLSPEQLQDKYKRILQDVPAGNVTIHCGSGVTACHTILAMAHAGMEIPSLYVGSWSEWSRNDKPIGKNV